jgi:hypothetical protein
VLPADVQEGRIVPWISERFIFQVVNAFVTSGSRKMVPDVTLDLYSEINPRQPS